MGKLTIDSEVVKKFGFPEAVVLAQIEEESEGQADTTRNIEGWVKLSTEDIFKLCNGTVGNSTIRAAVTNLVRAKRLIKSNGGPKGSTDHPMDRTCWYKIPKKK